MSLETAKMPALVAPRTHGELQEYLMRVGNHPNRFQLMQEPEFETFKEDEHFLLRLLTQNTSANTALPKEAITGAQSINKFLEPNAAWSFAAIQERLMAIAASLGERFRGLVPAFNERPSSEREAA